MKRVFLFFTALIVLGKLAIMTSGCANIIPPSGGPRDSIPPQLIRATPTDSTKQFKQNKISFSFDDYVDVQNIQQELIMSPNPQNNPVVETRLNTVTVRLRDSLEANTTYTIDFGNAIKDINEGNVLKNFTYTFTTGNYFDSLQFGGNVLLAESGKIDTSLIVMLHSKSDDSVLINEKPRYFTRLDSKGNFLFKNLPPKTYYVYALQDENGSRRYMDVTKLFAFADQPVTIGPSTPRLTLYAYAEEARKTTASSTAPKNKTNAADRRLKFTTSLINAQQDLLSNFTFNFELPLKHFDSSKVGFFTDTLFTPVTNYRFTHDSTNTKFSLVHTWKENTLYHLILDKEFAEDSSGKKLLRSDTISFKSRRISEYGKVAIRFRNLDVSKNPLLVFLLNNTIVQSYPLPGPEFTQPLFVPGDYELRIVYDANKNGKWDTGEFFGKHRQPEMIKPIERRISVKPNWDNEFEIAL